MSNAGHAKKTTENRRRFAFGGWSAHTLLEFGEITIVQIAELALREGHSFTPLCRIHRWFARRVGSQFRSILTALDQQHFWVQVKRCTNCHCDVELHPHYQLVYSKEKGLQWMFCKECHAVHELQINRKVLYCECGKRATIATGTHSNGRMTCPYCKHTQKIAAVDLDSATSPYWKMFAQEYLIGTGRNCTWHFKRVEKCDLKIFAHAERMLQLFGEDLLVPTRKIPREDRSDGRPLIHGIRTYADFFNARQKLHLQLLGAVIQRVENGEARRCLELAFSEHLTTNCMYTAYTFGYHRISPMFSIHSYRHITRTVELNP